MLLYTYKKSDHMIINLPNHQSQKIPYLSYCPAVGCHLIEVLRPEYQSNISLHVPYYGLTGFSVWRYSKKWPLRKFLLYFFGLFCLFKPPYQNRVVAIFSPLHAWLPFRIQNGRFVQCFTGIEKQVEKHVILFV